MNGWSERTNPLRRVDPRSKILVQIAVVAAAYAHTEPLPLLLLTIGTVAFLRVGGLTVISTLWEFRAVAVFLAIAPFLAAVTPRFPFLILADGIETTLASYRVLLLVLISVAIVRTTTPREAEAAVRWGLPGKIGRVIGLGVGLVFRFLPVIRAEAIRTKRAITLRGGAGRPLHERMRLVGMVTFIRLLNRADRIDQAMRVRCLAWNASIPRLTFSRIDIPVLGGSILLLVWTALSLG